MTVDEMIAELEKLPGNARLFGEYEGAQYELNGARLLEDTELADSKEVVIW
jgi:hypothetical protein